MTVCILYTSRTTVRHTWHRQCRLNLLQVWARIMTSTVHQSCTNMDGSLCAAKGSIHARSRYLEHNVAAGRGYLYICTYRTGRGYNQSNSTATIRKHHRATFWAHQPQTCLSAPTLLKEAHRSPYFGQAVSATLRGQPHASFTYRGFFERTSNQDSGWGLEFGPGRLTCDGILRREGQIHHPLRL